MADSAQGTESDGVPLWQVVCAVGLAVAVLIGGSVLAWVVFAEDDDQFGSPAGTTTAPTGAPGVQDEFDREGARTLGRAADGSEWTIVSGTWGIADGAAAVITPNPDGPRSVAVLDMGSSDGSVSVDASALAQGWGMVFRYRGSFNYWMIVASPEYATYNVQKVVDGAVVSIGTLGLVPTADGTTIRVDLRGPSFEVFVNGDLAGSFEDAHLQGATQVGLVAQGAAAEIGRWDSFAAVPAATPTPVTVPTMTRPPGSPPRTAPGTSAPPSTSAPTGAPG